MDPEKVAEAYHAFEQGGSMAPLTAAAISNQTIQESMRLLLLLRAYQVRLICPSGRSQMHATGRTGRAGGEAVWLASAATPWPRALQNAKWCVVDGSWQAR